MQYANQFLTEQKQLLVNSINNLETQLSYIPL